MKWIVLAITTLLIYPAICLAEPDETFSNEKPKSEEESVLDAVFGSAPPLPTQHGLLIIKAYHDENGNQKRDKGETEVTGDLFCLVDEVEYTIPAFIPGLDPGTPYPVLCSGEQFAPSKTKETVLFRYKGEIITLLIAGTPVEEVSVQKSSPVMISRHPSKSGD